MPICNLIEYSKNYRQATGRLWNYYRDQTNNPLDANYDTDSITNSASFKYKTSITGKNQMPIKKMVKTLSKEIQKLKKVLKLLFH